MMLNIEQKFNEQFLTVSLTGRIEGFGIDELDNLLQEITKKGHLYVVFDLTNLRFITSSGFRLFLILRNRLAKNNGIFILCNIPDDIMHIMCVAGFDRIFNITDDVAKALDYLHKLGISQEKTEQS